MGTHHVKHPLDEQPPPFDGQTSVTMRHEDLRVGWLVSTTPLGGLHPIHA